MSPASAASLSLLQSNELEDCWLDRSDGTLRLGLVLAEIALLGGEGRHVSCASWPSFDRVPSRSWALNALERSVETWQPFGMSQRSGTTQTLGTTYARSGLRFAARTGPRTWRCFRRSPKVLCRRLGRENRPTDVNNVVHTFVWPWGEAWGYTVYPIYSNIITRSVYEVMLG